jgi:hypothetical protein
MVSNSIPSCQAFVRSPTDDPANRDEALYILLPRTLRHPALQDTVEYELLALIFGLLRTMNLLSDGVQCQTITRALSIRCEG